MQFERDCDDASSPHRMFEFPILFHHTYQQNVTSQGKIDPSSICYINRASLYGYIGFFFTSDEGVQEAVEVLEALQSVSRHVRSLFFCLWQIRNEQGFLLFRGEYYSLCSVIYTAICKPQCFPLHDGNVWCFVRHPPRALTCSFTFEKASALLSALLSGSVSFSKSVKSQFF